MALYEVDDQTRNRWEVKTLSSLTRFRGVLQNFSDALIQQVSASTANTACSNADADNCRDDAESLKLKLVAVVLILMTGVAGIAIPLVGRKRRFLRTDSSAFVLIKAFAAGVILATGFVHMLPDGQEALDNSCLPSHPWSDFPFPGFIAMMASLGTLVLDFLGTQFYARKHKEHGNSKIAPNPCVPELIEDSNVGILISSGTEVEELVSAASSGCKHEESMHIVGMYAHAAAHRHSHPHPHGHSENAASSATQSAHSGHYEENESSLARHAVISQILELGIVSHSIIIGLSLGVSRSPCTIRPLMGALSFHQFFEGFALGGCISQAQFGAKVATTMACFFAITTPSGIAVGAALSSFYNPNSPRALIVEGVLDSISAGILIYMALVDLIGADFLSRSMSCSSKLQALSYVALFLGALSMALLALWA